MTDATHPDQTLPFRLEDRALVRLEGADVDGLLQRLITTDMDDVAVGQAAYGALLTPQGKILFDFLIQREKGGILFDLPRIMRDDFIRKMTLYRMRADATISALEQPVALSFAPLAGGVGDPRGEGLGYRLYGLATEQTRAAEDADLDALQRALIAAGVPQGGLDFAYGDAFPHDINLDDLGALDFEKGCYVGQEVVSRMKHRGTTRKRLVRLESAADMPPTGTPVLAGDKSVGQIGARCGREGLAILRLDRVADARAEGQNPRVDGQSVDIHLFLAYANFSV